jgi:hypothetical protein
MNARATLLMAVLLGGCASGAGEPGDRDVVRPHAHAGPFRPLRENELSERSGLAPYPLKSSARQFRQPTVLELTPSGRPGPCALYAVARIARVTGIYRFLAPDARSFTPDPNPQRPILRAELSWEGDWVGSPSAHRVGEQVWLFYAAAGGIGLARSTDGVEFMREASPVLAIDTSVGWEGGLAPSDPSFLQVGLQDYRLYYSVSGRIGEARSRNGTRWDRMEDGPLLEPAARSAASPAYDDAAVEEPHALLAQSPEGRRITRIYYAAVDSAGMRTVGLAARFGTAGPLQRAVSPVFATGRNPRSPWVLPLDDFALLFVTQQAGAAAALDFPAIAMGVTPPSISLSLR